VIISHIRTYLTDKTVGRLLVEDKEFGITLEDIGRPSGVKIPSETCIPEGEYKVAITMSARFGRPMILLYTNPQNFNCEHDGQVFSGIRVHGGTKISMTAGCILVPDPITVNYLENLIGKTLKAGEQVTWLISRE
jgi:hypothetical protein